MSHQRRLRFRVVSNPGVTDRGLDNVFRLTNRDDHKGPALAAYLYRKLGIAYARSVEWDEKGDNRAAVIFLNVVEGDRFKEVGEVGQADLAK